MPGPTAAALAERRRQQAWRATVHLSQLLMRQLDRDLKRARAELARLRDPGRAVRGTGPPAADDRAGRRTSQSRSRLSHQDSGWRTAAWSGGTTARADKRGTFAVLTAEGMAVIERVAPDHVENVRRHFIDRLSPRQLEEIKDAFGPIVEYLRKIRDRD